MSHTHRSAAALSIAVVSSCVGSTLAQSTERVSVSTSGAQGMGLCNLESMSADGRFVAFQCHSNNLVPGDTNAKWDIFVRDRQLGTTERVSVATGGAQGDWDSSVPSISADGRFVAFESNATTLVVGDTNGYTDVFVHDRQSSTTERVSVSSGGAEGDFQSKHASISGDGRFVAFYSGASNLVTGDTNNKWDVFVRDRTSGTTERVSLDSGGAQANGDSAYPAISADGWCVAYVSWATNLVPGDTNGVRDTFVRDRQSSLTERVSVDSNGVEGNNVSESSFNAISADGRFALFSSEATNLVAADTNNLADAFVRDRASGTTECVSVSASGAQANYPSYVGAISADGRLVTFGSAASNLVAGDTNGFYDVFVRDRTLLTTERASVGSAGQQANSNSSLAPTISADGRCVAFSSLASNLVAGDTNGQWDTFVRDRTGPPPLVYCTAGTTTNGCSASISASASPSVSLAHACILSVASVEGLKFGILFYGIDNSGFSPITWAPGSTSLRCVKYPVQRTPLQNSGGTFNACDGSYALDWNAYQAANPLALGNPWNVGAKIYAQAWFRDPPAVKSTNLSNAVELTYLP